MANRPGDGLTRHVEVKAPESDIQLRSVQESKIDRHACHSRARVRTISVLTAIVFLAFTPVSPQRLPIISYQIADGLPHNNVKRIFQDAKGYLWIATWEGLSRFDGYEFTNYDANDGLGHPFINDVTADNNGDLWVATNGGGVSRLIDQPAETSPAERKKFVSFLIAEGGEANVANFVNRILFDRENRLWCVTDGGLYRASSSPVVAQAFELVMRGGQPIHGNAALLDSRGRLWFGVSSETDHLLEITGDKTTAHELREGAEPPREIHTVIEDDSGRILAADLTNVFELVEPVTGAVDRAWRKLPVDLSSALLTIAAVSYTHLTLPTILRV